MRAVWSGSVSFGLVNIPVKLYSAAQERALNFRMLDKENLKPVHYKHVDDRGREIAQDDIVKGFEYKKGKFITLSDADFRRAATQKSDQIEIVAFVDEDGIDRRLYDKPYILEPESKAGKAYALLREALKKSGKVAIARFVMRERAHIAVLKSEGKALILDQLRYKDELRDPKDLKLPAVEAPPKKEMELALSLIEHLSGAFDPSDYEDKYADELKKVIAAKAKGKVDEEPEEEAEPEPTSVDDMLEALRKSLAAERGSREHAHSR